MSFTKHGSSEISMITDGISKTQIVLSSATGFYVGPNNVYSSIAESNFYIDTALKVSGISYGNGYTTFTNYSDERLKKYYWC